MGSRGARWRRRERGARGAGVVGGEQARRAIGWEERKYVQSLGRASSADAAAVVIFSTSPRERDPRAEPTLFHSRQGLHRSPRLSTPPRARYPRYCSDTARCDRLVPDFDCRTVFHRPSAAFTGYLRAGRTKQPRLFCWHTFEPDGRQVYGTARGPYNIGGRRGRQTQASESSMRARESQEGASEACTLNSWE